MEALSNTGTIESLGQSALAALHRAVSRVSALLEHDNPSIVLRAAHTLVRLVSLRPNPPSRQPPARPPAQPPDLTPARNAGTPAPVSSGPPVDAPSRPLPHTSNRPAHALRAASGALPASSAPPIQGRPEAQAWRRSAPFAGAPGSVNARASPATS